MRPLSAFPLFRLLLSDMRFSAAQHLRRPREIRAVREQGRRLECQAFTVWWKHRDGSESTAQEPASRVCVIASTAAVGGAIQRNRAKRRLRELYRLRQHDVPANCDLLLIARKAALGCPVAWLETRFTEACRKIAEAQG